MPTYDTNAAHSEEKRKLKNKLRNCGRSQAVMLIFGNVLVLALTAPNLRPGAAEFKGDVQYPSRPGDLPVEGRKGRAYGVWGASTESD